MLQSRGQAEEQGGGQREAKGDEEAQEEKEGKERRKERRREERRSAVEEAARAKDRLREELRASVAVRKVRFERIQARLAEVCAAVLADPEGAVTSSAAAVEAAEASASDPSQRMGDLDALVAAASARRAQQRKHTQGEEADDDIEGAGESDLGMGRDKDKGKKSKGRSRMAEMLGFADDPDPEVQELVLVALVTVFRDILPAYKIRALSKKELSSAKVKNETRRVQAFERTLLQAYQTFLQQLDAWITKGIGKAHATQPAAAPRSTEHRTALAALEAVGELLLARPFFNFRTNLLRILTQRAAQPIPEVCRIATNALRQLFRVDRQGDVALEAVRLLVGVVTKRQFKVLPEAVSCFQALRLHVSEDAADDARADAQRLRQQLRRDKAEHNDIDLGLREAQVGADPVLVRQHHADSLTAVSLFYFRVLKHKAADRSLLPVVMDGIARIAHLINEETVYDLVVVLREMLDSDRLSLPAVFHCCRAALLTLRGPGRELHIDEKDFVAHLYKALGDLVAPTDGRERLTADSGGDTLRAALSCVDHAFLRRQETSTVRVGAIAKRLTELSLHASPTHLAPILAMTNMLLTRYPQTHALLESEEDTVASGEYDPAAVDPERSHPFASSAWGLTLLQQHVSLPASAFSHDVARVDDASSARTPLDWQSAMRSFTPGALLVSCFPPSASTNQTTASAGGSAATNGSSAEGGAGPKKRKRFLVDREQEVVDPARQAAAAQRIACATLPPQRRQRLSHNILSCM